MAAANQVGKAAPNTKGVNVISVRLPRHDIPKKYSILKFNVANNVDFTNCGQAKLERENNFKEFKSAYDLETMPKFGAGSEYGREQKEEARKKKFGIKIKKYNPHDQSWLMKLGSGKQARRFKGIRKGGVLENASYYIFTQRPDGAFEASPVDEWFDFLPQARYKALTAEEAEEQFNKRGKTLNHFAIMVRNRFKGAEGDDEAEGDPSEKKKKGKKGRALTLTDGDDWADTDEDENEEDEGNAEDKDKDDEEKPKKKKEKKKDKEESDNEAFEEQDEFDEGKELDYSSGSSSDDEQMYDETGRDEKYQEKGVVDEDGLRKLLDSDEEDEEEEKKDEENEEDEEGQAKEEQNKASDSESSSDSDIDSDPEKDFTSPLLLSKHSDEPSNNTTNRSTTPLPDAGANGKRKKPETQSPTANAAKKPKLETAAFGSSTPAPALVASSSNSSSSSAQSEGGIEGLVKRYLTRKPMTLKDLLQKITSKYQSMQTTEQIAKEVGRILQRLNLDKLKANNKLYFSIKKDSSS